MLGIFVDVENELADKQERLKIVNLELELAEQSVAALHTQLQATYKQINASDRMIAEIQAEKELAAA